MRIRQDKKIVTIFRRLFSRLYERPGRDPRSRDRRHFAASWSARTGPATRIFALSALNISAVRLQASPSPSAARACR